MNYLKKKNEIISYIYQLRVLTYYEIYDYLFKPYGLSDSYCHKIIKEMVSEKLLEKNGLRKNESYYFVTLAGLKLIKENGLIHIGSDSPSSAPDLLPAHKVKIHEVLVNHQTSLNHFVLEYASKTDSKFSYYDEKFVSQVFPGARPDGLIREGQRLLFLEMDMNTEDKRALNRKWENYRTLIGSESFFNIRYPSLIVFILGGNISDRSNRKSFLRKQILENIGDHISPKKNVIIGTEKELLQTLINKDNSTLINHFTSLGYNIFKGSNDQGSLSGYEFDLYINKTDENNKIVNLNGKYDEFLVDDMTDGNLYTYKKLSNYESILSKFMFMHKRMLKYIILVNSEAEAYRLALDAGNFSNFVYYSTPSRLSAHPLHTALFQVDRLGNSWHFEGPDLRIRADEENLSTF